MIGIYSKGISNIPFLESFLKDEVVLNPKSSCSLNFIAGWGRKESAAQAIQKAKKRGVPYLSLEDGFIRSIELGVHEARRLSLIADPIGIYYDATSPSRLEEMLNHDVFPEELLNEAAQCIEFIIEHKISKYNHTDNTFIPKNYTKKNILLIDQTANDMSVELGLANEESFKRMYEYALATYPDENIYIKVHPDVIAQKKRGYLSEIPPNSLICVISEDINPVDLLSHMDHVMVVTSQLGFEALMLGKRVSCFGLPFYAGWGLTDDQLESDRRTKSRSLLEVFAAAYLRYPSYIRPETGIPGRLMDVLQYIVLEKQKDTRTKIYNAVGIPKWKRQFIRPFFNNNESIHFLTSQEARPTLEDESKVVVWSYQSAKMIEGYPDSRIERIEDGFYRSVGLGSNFHAPWSLIKDDIGMYFNPQSPSRLEKILNIWEFDEIDLEEARLIREYILEHQLSKYNVDVGKELILNIRERQKILFVPGQVADDASILYGCTGSIRSTEGLLRYLRETFPDAFILFKPHPDVVKRNRQGVYLDEDVAHLCDQVETEASVLQCIEKADEVHTLTSQSGFDALLRGRKVYTYGGPFYAGWGLTSDFSEFPRRNRRLSIDELVAGALIYYPKYFNWDLRQQTDCRSVLRKLVAQREGKSRRVYTGLLDTNKTRWLRRYLYLSREILGLGK